MFAAGMAIVVICASGTVFLLNGDRAMKVTEFAILGREVSARCQYTQKKTECFRVQIPIGSPAVLISADAIMQEIRKAGIQAALEGDDQIALAPTSESPEVGVTLTKSITRGSSRSATKTA